MLWPTLVTTVLVTACAANPPPKEPQMHDEEVDGTPTEPTPVEPRFSPRWRRGDSWVVRYRVAVPNPAKSASAPPRFEERDWRYTVDSVSPRGEVHVSALALDEDAEHWRMVFGKHGELLELEAPRADADAPTPGPFVHLSPAPAWGLTPSWPGFPVEPGALSLEQGALVQQVATDGATWTVTMVRRGVDAGTDVERTVVQRWDAERPWWTMVRIDRRTTWKGQVHDALELEGHVTSWELGSEEGARP